MILISIPYAFGNANIYLDLFYALKNSIKTTAVEYPGHGRRFDEELLYKMEDIVEDVYEQIEQLISSGEDYCLLGYSMGGLVAYELYYRILSAGKKLPSHIFIMGTYEPMHIHEQKDFENFNLEQIRDELAEHDGTPDELLECDELIELMMPIVKADNIVLRDYRCNKRDESVVCDVTVVRGTEEEELENCKEGWEYCIGHECEYITIEGEHFFLFEEGGRNINKIVDIIENNIETLSTKEGKLSIT